MYIFEETRRVAKACWMRATCGLDFAIQQGEAVADIHLREEPGSYHEDVFHLFS